MSNIRYLESQLDLFWRNNRDEFAGFDRPQIVPAASIRGNAPMYLRRYIDNDPNSFYMFIAGDPIRHEDISRDKACEFFDRFFYEHMRMPSSYDIAVGGDYSREQAIDKEVLPARDDSAYRTYYQEQMDALRQMMRDDAGTAPELPKAADDVIDMVQGDDGKYSATGIGTTAVGASAGTAVGMPKKIWYGVDFHISAGGGMLGNNRGSNRIDGRRSTRRLREGDLDAMVDEALIGRTGGMIGQHILDAISLAGCDDGVGLALCDVYEKFFGPLPAGVCEGGLRESVDGETADEIGKILGKGGKRKLNEDDFESERRFAKEDLQEWYPDATEEQIDTALNRAYGDHNRVVTAFERNDPTVANIWAEVASECLEQLLREAKNADEDDDILPESVVRHANMLAREIW